MHVYGWYHTAVMCPQLSACCSEAWHALPARAQRVQAVLFLPSADSEPVSDTGMQGTTTGLTDLTLVDCSSLQNRGLVRAALLPLHAATLKAPLQKAFCWPESSSADAPCRLLTKGHVCLHKVSTGRRIVWCSIIHFTAVAGVLQGQLVEAAPRLTSLTLIKCPWLTNSAVKHLQHLRGLAALSLADNGNIRCGGSRPKASCHHGQWLRPWR